MLQHPTISQLKLTNFRNYQQVSFDFNSNIIALFGENGIGKTNIMEAITLLSKGKGLRGADFDEMVNGNNQSNQFTIFGKIDCHPECDQIGTSYDKSNKKRIIKIDNNINNKIHPTFIWIIPQMDSLFTSSKAIRRKFLDKITADIDQLHSTRINSYDKLLRERMNILTEFGSENNDEWLNALEHKIAELGSAIAIARNEAIDHLNQSTINTESNFIKAHIKIIGEIEELALNNKALFVEEHFINQLKKSRGFDAKTGRSMFGVHRSDFTAILINKNIEARLCSTGEQKSILIALTFARINIFSHLNLPAPILILDELVSHLDPKKRKDLFSELIKYQVQTFLTATDKKLLSDLNHYSSKSVQFLEIK